MGRLSRCLVPQLESVFDCLKMLFLALVWSEVTLCLMEAFLFPGAAPLNGKGLLVADGGTEGGLEVSGGSLVGEGAADKPMKLPICSPSNALLPLSD